MSVHHAMRTAAREIFQHALAESSVEKAFGRHLSCERGVLRVCEDLYDLKSYSRVFAVSFGKAGHRMAEIFSRVAGTQDRGNHRRSKPAQLPTEWVPIFCRWTSGAQRGINTRSGRYSEVTGCTQSAVTGDLHGERRRLRRSWRKPQILKSRSKIWLLLIARWCIPGAPIAQINAVRKHLSAVKGGRMAQAAQGAQQVSILISDVPEKSLDALSSGPTMPDSSTVEDCYRIADEYQMLKNFPASVRELFDQRSLEETPKKDDPVFARSRWWKVLSSDTAERAAATAAISHGFAVEIDNSCDDWDFARAADHLLERVRRLRRGVSKACIISGGEVTVKVGRGAGTGGRNQHFALYCAEKIKGENITVLSAGTDGVDGNSRAAGGVADRFHLGACPGRRTRHREASCCIQYNAASRKAGRLHPHRTNRNQCS